MLLTYLREKMGTFNLVNMKVQRVILVSYISVKIELFQHQAYLEAWCEALEAWCEARLSQNTSKVDTDNSYYSSETLNVPFNAGIMLAK